jgi:hypothetical protein
MWPELRFAPSIAKVIVVLGEVGSTEQPPNATVIDRAARIAADFLKTRTLGSMTSLSGIKDRTKSYIS